MWVLESPYSSRKEVYSGRFSWRRKWAKELRILDYSNWWEDINVGDSLTGFILRTGTLLPGIPESLRFFFFPPTFYLNGASCNFILFLKNCFSVTVIFRGLFFASEGWTSPHSHLLHCIYVEWWFPEDLYLDYDCIHFFIISFYYIPFVFWLLI